MVVSDGWFNNFSEGVFLLDTLGNIISCNQAACSLTGFEKDEIENRPFPIVRNDDNDKIKYQYELNLALQRKKVVAEGWIKRKDQSTYWAETTLSPSYDGSGQHTGFMVLLQDRSQHRQTFLSVRKSEERYRLMVEGIKDYSIFMLDASGTVVTWNDGGELIQGYSSGEIIGKHFSLFYTTDDLLIKKPELELQIASTTGSYREEGWRVRKGGSVFWASVVITALLNDRNILVGFSKIVRDLTERIKNGETLRQSEARYRSLVEQVADYGIFMLDEKGRIISWNEGAKRIKGYTSEDVIGKYFSIFYPEEDILNDKPGMELRIAKIEGKYEEEGWRIRKDGSRFWANVVITPVYNIENGLVGFSKVTRDLTERKKNEQALHESYESYRQLVAELSVTNAELMEANKELEQFTAIVSHDLKEPVRTVKSFLLLMEKTLDQGQYQNIKGYIGKSIHASQRMQDLIDNLLYYSQISRSPLLKEDVGVENLIQEALQNLSAAIERSHASIIIDNQADVLQGDRVQLVQLFQNILANALKFTGEKTPNVTIDCLKEGDQVKFIITDNGIGIDQQDLEKIFEVFRRLNLSQQYPGTGVGLAICKKVVERHKGEIWAESVPGKGTTFFIILPQN